MKYSLQKTINKYNCNQSIMNERGKQVVKYRIRWQRNALSCFVCVYCVLVNLWIRMVFAIGVLRPHVNAIHDKSNISSYPSKNPIIPSSMIIVATSPISSSIWLLLVSVICLLYTLPPKKKSPTIWISIASSLVFCVLLLRFPSICELSRHKRRAKVLRRRTEWRRREKWSKSSAKWKGTGALNFFQRPHCICTIWKNEPSWLCDSLQWPYTGNYSNGFMR